MLSNFLRLQVYSYLPWRDMLVNISKLSTRERLLLPSSKLLGCPKIVVDLTKPVECDISTIHYLFHLTSDIELKLSSDQSCNFAYVPTILDYLNHHNEKASLTLFLKNAK